MAVIPASLVHGGDAGAVIAQMFLFVGCLIVTVAIVDPSVAPEEVDSLSLSVI